MLNIRLPDSLSQELTQEARRCNTSRSEIARQALLVYLRAQRRQRHIKQLQGAAGQLVGAESCALAEEGLLFDNEALSMVEESPLSGEAGKWWR